MPVPTVPLIPNQLRPNQLPPNPIPRPKSPPTQRPDCQTRKKPHHAEDEDSPRRGEALQDDLDRQDPASSRVPRSPARKEVFAPYAQARPLGRSDRWRSQAG